MLCQLALPFERPKLHVWKCDFDLERAGTMWCADASEFHSDPKVWSTVLFGRLRPTTVHRTRPLEHCGPWRATSGQFLCEYPKQGQSPLLQRSALHALLNSCMSAWTHQLHKRNPAAKHGWDYWHVVRDDGCSDGWQVHKVGIHATISTKECYIVHRHWVHKPQQCHHFGEALYGNYLQKPRCMRCLHPKAECYIVHHRCVHKPQQCHHFGEALYGNYLQKPGCMRCLHPKAECCIVHRHWVHKPQQCHHFGEALYGNYLQKPRCMRCLHPKAECYIVHHRCVHKPQQCHHFGEALSGETLQKPRCMRCLHPKAECCIVQSNCLHKPQQCHHFGEALYGNYLQKPRCMRCLHPKAECCIVQSHCLYKPQQCHHFGEALSGETLQKPGCMRCLHPKAECYILHRDSFHKPQQCHHFGEALYGTYLQIPCQDIRILIGIAILVNDSISGLLQVDCFGPVTQRWCCWLRFAMSKALGQNLCWFMGQTVTECDRYVDVSWGHGQYPRPLNTVCLMAPRSP